MTIAIVTFTQKARELSCNMKKMLSSYEVLLFDGRKGMEEVSVDEWLGLQFEKRHMICFISACQIAVRKIAPFINNKLTDSPVIVVDELGQYVIPVLSGHVGGANEISRQIASLLQATPVITTATDLYHKLAIDVFAKNNGLTILNKQGIACISGMILEDKKPTVKITKEIEKCYEKENGTFKIGHHEWKIPDDMTRVSSDFNGHVDVCIGEAIMADATLSLKPKRYVIGVGCRKGKQMDELLPFIEKHLKLLELSIGDIVAMTSIDEKRTEQGILQISEKYQIPFFTYSGEILAKVEGSFTASTFVKSKMGVDNVCERSCIAYCNTAQIILPKQAYNGMTLAVAKM